MARLVAITDAKKRDAHVAMETAKRVEHAKMVAPSGEPVRLERLIRSTVETCHDALAKNFGAPESIVKALVDGDPEIPLHVVGRKLGDASRISLRKDGTLLAVARMLQVVKGPDGVEKSRQEFVDVEATVSEESPPLPWTGKLMPIDEVVRKVAFVRSVQLRHVSGLTYEFLYEISKTLAEAGKMLLVGSGAKGQGPLILSTNGSPYRGFLEGRVKGNGYRLVLHLSNLELKSGREKAS